MADAKISALPASSLPLTGTEVLPLVQGGVTKKVANNDLRPKQIQSNATSGVLQVAGPAASTTRVMTTPDANFTVARTDASQTFIGSQTFSDNLDSVLNGTFEDWTGAAPASWGIVQNVSKETTIVYAGANSSKFAPAGGGVSAYLYQNQTITAGKTYTVSFYLYGDGSAFNISVAYANAPTSSIISIGAVPVGAASWRQITFTFQATATRNALLFLPSNNNAYTFYVDNVTLQEVAFINAGGINLTGNLVIGTSGKGIDFSADGQAAGMTSELLDDYEEGTWTPVLNNFTSTNTPTVNGIYTKVGRLVTVIFEAYELAIGDITTTSASFISGLPFSISGIAYGVSANMTTNSGTGSATNGYSLGTNIYPGTSAASAIKYVTCSYFV
jgi:hypothetical protein